MGWLATAGALGVTTCAVFATHDASVRVAFCNAGGQALELEADGRIRRLAPGQSAILIARVRQRHLRWPGGWHHLADPRGPAGRWRFRTRRPGESGWRERDLPSPSAARTLVALGPARSFQLIEHRIARSEGGAHLVARREHGSVRVPRTGLPLDRVAIPRAPGRTVEVGFVGRLGDLQHVEVPGGMGEQMFTLWSLEPGREALRETATRRSPRRAVGAEPERSR